MPGVTVSNIARKAIEELFEGRNDREFARITIETSLEDQIAEWERILGTKSSFTVTATEDGFRVILAILKDFNA